MPPSPRPGHVPPGNPSLPWGPNPPRPRHHPYRAAGKRRTGTVTRALDIGAIRAQVRALDYVRGTPADVAMWREGDAEPRATLAIEGMDLDADEHALFAMLRADENGRATCRAGGCW